MTAALTGIHSRLLLDHAELEGFLERLIAAFRTGDRDAAREAYREVETRLTAHIAMEEELLFPDFEKTEPGETHELTLEHAAIRARLEELAIGVDLHATRLPAIEELAQMLRKHGQRENELLYRWADRVYSDETRRPDFENFFSRIRAQAGDSQAVLR
ncbi:MAG TPA: hemerythrin domain-containing protein [Kofleriaceae bacterium]|nr:hemerythrin domain-containing protein [Kofleriaceae bacterium]